MIKSNFKKAIVLLMTLAMIPSYSACSKTPSSSPNTSTTIDPAAPFSYPMKSGVTLTLNYPGAAMEQTPEWAKEKAFWTVVQKKTGVTLKVVKGDPGKAEEFNLMLASGDLPDLVVGNWLAYPGGPEQAIRQGILMKLNDAFNKYSPNLTKILKENPQYAKDIKSDEGSYYAYPLLRNKDTVTYQGLTIRGDKLQKYNLKEPTTFNEYYNVLKTFKSDPECVTPFTFEYRWLFGDQSGLQNGAGVKSGFWVENGKVINGESQPAYKDFLATMNKWYTEGLIDPDMPSIDKATALAKFSSGKAWTTIMQSAQADTVLDANVNNPNFKVTGLRSPVKNAGERPKFGQAQNIYPGQYAIGISAKSKNVEAAARFLDYMFSEEGHILTQFGTEGYTFVKKDGKIVYEDPSLPALPQGANILDRLGTSRQPTNWPTIQEGKEYKKYQASYDAVDKWSDSDMLKYLVPPITFTSQESSEYAKLFSDYDTYVRENVVKFIIGKQPISAFDDFVNGMKKLGLDRIIQLQQAAVDRYNSRK